MYESNASIDIAKPWLGHLIRADGRDYYVTTGVDRGTSFVFLVGRLSATMMATGAVSFDQRAA
jgi:hypothetical protein